MATPVLTNDRVIDQLKALSEKYGMMYGDLDVIDHAIEALHRADIMQSVPEPTPDHCPVCKQSICEEAMAEHMQERHPNWQVEPTAVTEPSIGKISKCVCGAVREPNVIHNVLYVYGQTADGEQFITCDHGKRTVVNRGAES